MTRKIIAFVFILFFANYLFSQNTREELPLGANFYLGGPASAISGSLDYFIKPSLNFEVGIGTTPFNASGFAGLKFHTNEHDNWSLYTGALGVVSTEGYDSQRKNPNPKFIGLAYL